MNEAGEKPFVLSLPSDGGRTTRRVLTRFLKTLLRGLLTLPTTILDETRQSDWTRLCELIGRLAQADRPRLYGVLRRPQLHMWLTTTLAALEQGDRPLAGQRADRLVLQLLFELALDSWLPAEGGVTWPAPAKTTTLLSPTHLAEITLPPGEPVHFVPGMAGPSDKFVSVTDSIVLALADQNPISDFEAHPDKEGNSLDLGEADAAAWTAGLAEAMERVGAWLPDLRREMDLVLQQFVPVGTSDREHLSASYKEVVGTVYMTLHPDEMTMTEAVIHEYQHNKVNMLFHYDPVMHNAFWPLFPSPVRPDPRPLHGVLLAAHAFVPVAELYVAMLEGDAPLSNSPSFRKRFTAIVDKNDDALATLNQNAETTEKGARLLAELTALNARHLDLRAKL